MSVRKSVRRTLMTFGAVTSAALLLVPAGAGARQVAHSYGQRTYGATALVLNAGTATTLTSAPSAGGLGLSLAPVPPAYAANGAINFPITSSPLTALFSGNIYHSGGIALSGGGTTVDLTNFVINLWGQSLTADVSVTNANGTASLGPVNIVGLNFSGAHFGFGFGGLTVGPVQATLNQTALGALGGAFGVSALGNTVTSLPLGAATVGFHGWFF